MKRKNNLYQNTYKMENILQAYDEVCRNTKNKRKVRIIKNISAYIFQGYMRH